MILKPAATVALQIKALTEEVFFIDSLDSSDQQRLRALF